MFVTNTITSKDLNFEVKADGSAKSNKQLSAEASSELLIKLHFDIKPFDGLFYLRLSLIPLRGDSFLHLFTRRNKFPHFSVRRSSLKPHCFR
ncbi:MAG: hypothetical protein ACTS4V_00220 [Candidatus Hodgkinia cicadicola]